MERVVSFGGARNGSLRQSTRTSTLHRIRKTGWPLSAGICRVSYGVRLVGSLRPQLVAHAPDGQEEDRTGRVLLDLLPERVNVNIQHMLFEGIAFSPDPVQHLLAREDAAG